MQLGRHASLAAAVLIAAMVPAAAQQYAVPPQYAANPHQGHQGNQAYPPSPATALPPSWSYDPYTSGLGPCPQRGIGDPPCKEFMEPTYGQPNHWTGR